ncbi:interleukin-17 receptor A-like isoform X2 [Lampetra planeri]
MPRSTLPLVFVRCEVAIEKNTPQHPSCVLLPFEFSKLSTNCFKMPGIGYYRWVPTRLDLFRIETWQAMPVIDALFCFAINLSVVLSLLVFRQHLPPISVGRVGVLCVPCGLTAAANHHSWFTPASWTPSAPRSLSLSVVVAPGAGGRRTPWLRASWEVNPDGSINHLDGAELIITHGSKSHHIIFNFSKVPFPRRNNQLGQNWEFSFDQYEVEPSDYVTVTVYHLPRPSTGQDDAHVQDSIKVPGINWDPKMNITLASNSLRVFFNTAPYFDHYTLAVFFRREDNRDCFKEMETNVMKGAYDATESAVFIISSLERHCDHVTVKIRPFNTCCKSLCKGRRSSFVIDAEGGPRSPLVYASVGGALALLFVVTLIVAALRTARPQARAGKAWTVHRGGSSESDQRRQHHASPPHTTPDHQLERPRDPPTLLILYSLDHALFKDVILSFASLVQAHCSVKVALGLWSSVEVARRGPLAWVAARRQAARETGGRVLLVCSRGVAAKWEAHRAAAACAGEEGAALRLGAESHAGDHFSMALPLICADLGTPSLLGKYAVVYFDEVSNKKDIPDVFTPAKTYKLTSQLGKMCQMLSNLNSATRRHKQVKDWNVSASGKALCDAIKQFKLYQKLNPKWFEDECLR